MPALSLGRTSPDSFGAWCLWSAAAGNPWADGEEKDKGSPAAKTPSSSPLVCDQEDQEANGASFHSCPAALTLLLLTGSTGPCWKAEGCAGQWVRDRPGRQNVFGRMDGASQQRDSCVQTWQEVLTWFWQHTVYIFVLFCFYFLLSFCKMH